MVARIILETSIGRARGCCDWRARQDATTQRATARKAEYRRMARQAQCHRVRSALNQKENVIKGEKARFHPG